MTLDAAADNFLTQCTKCVVKGEVTPAFPNQLRGGKPENAVQGRIAFHGIALLLANHPSLLDNWPQALRDHTRSEARMQALWEISHAKTVAILLEALHKADIPALAMKGTALAYSLYEDAAMRRRGDTDILIDPRSREKARDVMRNAGFSRSGDSLALQENWFFNTGIKFRHLIDVHWRMNASVAVTAALEQNSPWPRAINLPRLSEHARGMSAVDSILHTSVNRAAHRAFGYRVEEDKILENNRLIWAVDLDKLGASLGQDDWSVLVEICEASGLSPLVLSGLEFAQSRLDTNVPLQVLEVLAEHQSDAPAARYFDIKSGRKRLALDLAACSSWREKAQIFGSALLPGRDFFADQRDDHARYPLAALQAKRLMGGALKMIAGRA